MGREWGREGWVSGRGWNGVDLGGVGGVGREGSMRGVGEGKYGEGWMGMVRGEVPHVHFQCAHKVAANAGTAATLGKAI